MTTPEITDRRIALLGDVHGSSAWVRTALLALHRAEPTVTTVIQLGDCWVDGALLRTIDEAAAEADLERFLVVPGNHERWDLLTDAGFETTPHPLWLSDRVAVLPRPYRMRIHGREVLTLGGAVSVDRSLRREGFDWWPAERITDQHVAAAIAGGPADVMLTHETPTQTPVRAVRAVLDGPVGWWADADLDASRESRLRIQRIWDAVQPRVFVHGHMHTAGHGTTPDGRRVESLGRDWQPRNLVILDLASLDVTPVSVPGDGTLQLR